MWLPCLLGFDELSVHSMFPPHGSFGIQNEFLGNETPMSNIWKLFKEPKYD